MEIDEIQKEWFSIKTSEKIIIEKYNKDNNLCKYSEIDTTTLSKKDLIEKFKETFKKLGYEIKTVKSSYQGIYDPSQVGKIVELHPTNEQLLDKELRFCILNK